MNIKDKPFLLFLCGFGIAALMERGVLIAAWIIGTLTGLSIGWMIWG